MAPRTGDKRLLAPIAKATSPGILPGLVAAAIAALLALTGCGGGGDPATEAQKSGAATTQAEATKQPQKAAEEANAAVPAGPSTKGGKHGQRISQPKGPREAGITPEERAQATIANVSLSSPVLKPGPEGQLFLPTPYTCEGKDAPPPLRWSGVPQGTAQLDLFVLNLEPVDGELFFDWAVADLDPELSELKSGELPKEAVVGENGFGKRGYRLCPEGEETYLFALYALPEGLAAKPGFDPAKRREEILAMAGSVGLLAARYGRG